MYGSAVRTGAARRSTIGSAPVRVDGATKLKLTAGSVIAKELPVLWLRSGDLSPVSATRQPLLVTGAGKPWRARMRTTQRSMIVALNHRHAIVTVQEATTLQLQFATINNNKSMHRPCSVEQAACPGSMSCVYLLPDAVWSCAGALERAVRAVVLPRTRRASRAGSTPRRELYTRARTRIHTTRTASGERLLRTRVKRDWSQSCVNLPALGKRLVEHSGKIGG
eukprot:scaffold101817_cov63-Phaeocystis_antarctica.AAC.3